MSAALIRVLGLGFLWRLGSPLASATAWSSWFAALFVAVWWSVLATVRARSAPSPLGSLCLWQRRGRVYSPCLIALVAARVRMRSVACCFADLLAPVAALPLRVALTRGCLVAVLATVLVRSVPHSG